MTQIKSFIQNNKQIRSKRLGQSSYENERKPVCRTDVEGPLDQRTEPVLVDVERQEGPGLACNRERYSSWQMRLFDNV